jgi:predicted AlkP superfamily pyrophosphatase or phosphodiesterase
MMSKKYLIITLLIILSACQFGGAPEGNVRPFKEEVESDFAHKKVVMILVDSMTHSLIDKGIEQGDLPALQFLKDNGKYYSDVVAPFPTMSVTIESSIVTGQMPDQHKIPGLAWYHPQEDRIVNYGTSINSWVRSGVTQGVYDALYHLNNTHLNKDLSTIFEDLDQRNITSGSINTLIYRGNKKHRIEIPGWVDEVIEMSDETIETKGPDILAFGRFSRPEIVNGNKDKLSDNILNRYGMHDKYSVEVFQALVEQGNQPDFLMVFLPDFDKIAHKHGSDDIERFKPVEQHIQQMLNSYESWEAALEENIFIVLGDHGQVNLLASEDELAINLDEIYSDYTIPALGEPVSAGEVAFGVNQRMTYVYDIHQGGQLIPELAERSLQDNRIALAAWITGDWVNVSGPDRQSVLRFKRGGEWIDSYHQAWNLDGDTTILNLDVDSKRHVFSYGDYPDALNQLESALRSHEIPTLILSAKPGYAFKSEGIPTHPGGGDHGGFHKDDSLAAMIIAGTEQQPQHERMVDLKKYILQLLSETPELKVKKKQVQKQEVADKKPPKIETDMAKKAKEISESIDGVTKAVSITLDQDTYVALQVEQRHRFQLKKIRKQTRDLLTHRFGKDIRPHVSTDWKIYRELERLDRQINGQKIKAGEVKKKLKKIEKDMLG